MPLITKCRACHSKNIDQVYKTGTRDSIGIQCYDCYRFNEFKFDSVKKELNEWKKILNVK
jgi:hypothetical protein